MRICIIGDIHWSAYSSILRSRGQYFSTRLENLIKSLNWVEQISEKYGCEEEIFLGDTFDKPELDSESITALTEVSWNKSSRLKHFIVGNHESGINTLKYNSTQILHKMGVVEDAPYLYPLDDKTEILFLPYISEDDRKPLADYLKNRNINKKLIICSHNDIKDFQMGMFLSKTGFSISEIEATCDLFINGHLHNGNWVTSKILNLGNLTGQNFSEDAFNYEHHIAILDTDTLELKFIENPYALNFYKLDIIKEKDLKVLDKLKTNSIISIRCSEELYNKIVDKLATLPNILEYRLVLIKELVNKAATELVMLTAVDHLEQFKQFILDTYGTTDIIKEELSEVCK